MEEKLPVLQEVRPLQNFCLYIRFSDGIEGQVDLSEFAGKGVFNLWNDYSEFEKASIGSGGELVWNEEVDMDGLAIYLRLTGKKPEDVLELWDLASKNQALHRIEPLN